MALHSYEGKRPDVPPDAFIADGAQLIGGVTVFGLPEGMPLVVDRNVMEREYVIVGGGSRSAKLRLDPAELRKLPGMRVEDIAAIR